MIKKLLIVALFLLSSFELIARDFVLTYPKSGTHWLLYSLASLTQRNAFGDQRFKDLVAMNLDLLPIEHLHFINEKFLDPDSDSQWIFTQDDRVILLLRDFKESLPRRHHEEYDLILSYIESGREEYLINLKTFDLLPEKSRLVLYYEDLCRFPEKTLGKALQFLGESDEKLADFIENLEFHKLQSISYYNSFESYGQAQSKGEDFLFHQKRAPSEFNQQLEALFLKKEPELSKKYLSRYFSTPFKN